MPANLFEPDPKTERAREWGSDLVSRDLAAAVATKVEQKEWWMLNGDGAICTTLVGLDFAAYRQQQRKVRCAPNLQGQWGIRLGPHANGAMAQTLKDPSSCLLRYGRHLPGKF